ncbi:helix-turn-helix domain-containing protein [Lacticaseibacillus baoqingensis]|uniref:Helix-turn-helix domain-containing protein n=1 Tax=Lacticaseibacillus baoqingensis TaxID=2486013 RepID=A0ABW4E8I7_9LACO|nr:helix-turn-helix domain-containing protein [Lacticaseibacillus baoqingensis]
MPALRSVLEQYFTVYHTPPFPAQARVINVAGTQLAVATADLTPREAALLEALTPTPANPDPWARFLTQNGPAPTKGIVRLIQLNVVTASSDPKLWLEALSSLFTTHVSGVWLTPTQALIVEPQSQTPLSLAELLSDLDTLDSDFDTQTRGYLGQFWPVDDKLPALFAEEQRLASYSGDRVTALPNIALSYYTQAVRERSPLLAALRTAVETDGDMRPVIASLYHHQGNVTAAAKALYLHRNTLQYRLEKFQAATGFSLRNMDDLVLCYLLIQGR